MISDDTEDKTKMHFLSQIRQVDLRDLSLNDGTVVFFDEILMSLPIFTALLTRLQKLRKEDG